MSVIQALAKGWQDLLAPPRCLGCLREMTWLCRECQPKVENHVLSCINCHRPQLRGLTCLGCRSHIQLTGLISVGAYHTPLVERGVHWLKFKGIQQLAPLLAQLLIFRLTAIATFEQLKQQAYFIPIPLHYRRQRLRGFNQSQLLAEAVTTMTDIPTLPLLTRARATWTQTKLTSELRLKNLENAFVLNTEPPADRSVPIILDDVTTTGTTLNAAAHVLKQSPHIRQLWGATIARG